ncbi:MAG: cobalamin biosynthesis protein CobD [Gemmatimonadaceae bacterium]|nr:cobalamin biosynthesis protein CobD [Gemmatimonadaceae bacterium]
MTGAVAGAATCALLCDVLVGEPPSPLHPTVWMGRWLAFARRMFGAPDRSDSPARALLAGVMTLMIGLLLVLMVSAVVAFAALLLATRYVSRFVRGSAVATDAARAMVDGLLLKPALALRALLSASREVASALKSNDLDRARSLLSWHLVSRDTTQLTDHEVAGATLSSLAENFSDSVVAPLLAYRLAGLPGAYGYRFVNTADAMHGYRTPALEWFGKPAARLDDVLNWVPARLAVAALVLGTLCCGGSVVGAVRAAWRDAGRTASPNGGWPMACLAGALDVQLVKRDHYVLNSNGQLPVASHVNQACAIVAVATLLVVVMIEISLVV